MSDVPFCADQQDEVIEFLSDPASYGSHAARVEQIDTHCSIVFLVGDRAYKLKRALRYASLDYTTRALRQAACDSEVALNRRTAPDIYLGVRSIKRSPQGLLAFDGPGPALDYVVVMCRFAQSDLFDHMEEAGRLTPDLIRQLGERVARFHLGAEILQDYGGAGAIGRVIAENDRELAKVATALDGASVGLLSQRCRSALDVLGTLLEDRRAQGKVRRCHGDLRLANICLYEGHPTPFDCIEFSEDISCIDVLYNLAFLLMDLELRERGDFANRAFNAYLDIAPETNGLRALPLFLALRAATRSYALAGRARRRSDSQEVSQLLAFAHAHIEAGLVFLAAPPPVLALFGTDADDAEQRAGALAWGIPPRPGARILPLAHCKEDEWSAASDLLAAGCSVLAAGGFTASEEQTARNLARRSVSFCLGIWIGRLPIGLDRGFWEQVRTEGEAIAALLRLLPQSGLAPAPRREVLD